MSLNKPHQQKIEQLLSKVGLNESEIIIYLTGLQLGPSSILHLATTAGIKRVTTHAIVDKLMHQGLFLDTHRAKKRLVYPATIDALYAIIETKKFEIEQLESQLSASAHIFEQIKVLSENFPNVRMLQGNEGINTTLVEMARDQEEVFVINDAHSFNKLIDEKTLHRSYHKRAEQKIRTKMVFPDGFKDFRHIQRDENYDIHIKTLPSAQLIDGGVDIRGKKVALHCYKSGFTTTTIIENQEIANIMKCMFNAIRSLARDYQGSFIVV